MQPESSHPSLLPLLLETSPPKHVSIPLVLPQGTQFLLFLSLLDPQEGNQGLEQAENPGLGVEPWHSHQQGRNWDTAGPLWDRVFCAWPCLPSEPGRQAAGERGLECSGATVTREKAVGAGPGEAAGHWMCLVGMSNVQRSG